MLLVNARWERSKRFTAKFVGCRQRSGSDCLAPGILVQADEISAVAVDGSNSMALKLVTADGRTQRFVFQTNHETIIFNTTLLQLQVIAAPGSWA